VSTKINWAANPDGSPGETINPVRGFCTPASPGCAHCYARRMAKRLQSMGTPGYQSETEATFWPPALHKVLAWRKPRTVFWGSMFDLFEERVTFEQIAACFGVMAATPRHVHVVLTKRAERMADWFRWAESQCSDQAHFDPVGETLACGAVEAISEDFAAELCDRFPPGYDWWPLPNVILMATTEDQQRFDERAPLLLQCPAAYHGISVEPMLGAMDVRWHLGSEAEWQTTAGSSTPGCVGIDWVICGAESGPGRRPMDPDWARSLRDQCVEAEVPFFLKQGPGDHGDALVEAPFLDGRQWLQRPEVFKP